MRLKEGRNESMKKGIEIFVSYAPQDEKLRDELINHLSVWEEQGLIVPWHNRDISAGTDWQREIDTHLKKALVILLLISPDFMASNYRNSTEVKQAMRRHVSGDAQVIPINLRPVSWKDAPFGNLQALPRDAKAITLWPNRDEAFEQVAAQIKVVVEDLLVER